MHYTIFYFQENKIAFSTMQVKRLEVGALVSIRGIGRVKIMEFAEASTQRQIQIL